MAFLADKGTQSGTVKSYVSAIKNMLLLINYQWDDNLILLNSITRGCRMSNDRVSACLPVTCGLLELILFEVRRMYKTQPYLETLFLAILALGYYGLFRVGELCKSDHVMKAKDVHVALNKEKILVILYSSKTPGKESIPQKVKITSNKIEKSGSYQK